MAKTISTIKNTVNKVQGSQKVSTSQMGGVNISGVAGVGVKSTPKRPESSRTPRIAHDHHTGPSHFGEELIDEDGGGAGAAPAMSVASGAAVPSITDPTTNYAAQKNKYYRSLLAKRKQPK